MFDASRTQTTKEKLGISSRYAYLGDALLRLSMRPLARVAFVVGVAYETLEQGLVAEDSAEGWLDIARHFGAHSRGAIQFGGIHNAQTRQALDRLIRIDAQFLPSNAELGAHDFSLSTFKNSLDFGNEDTDHFESIDTELLLHTSFAGCSELSENTHYLASAQLAAALSLLVDTGAVVKNSSEDSSKTPSLLPKFHSMSHLVVRLCRQSCKPFGQHIATLLLGLCYFVSGTALVHPNSFGHNPDPVAESAAAYFKKAAQTLESVQDYADSRGVLMLAKVASIMAQFRMFSLCPSCEVLPKMIREGLQLAVDEIVESDTTTDSVLEAARGCLSTLLIDIQGKLASVDDPINAALLSSWNLRVSLNHSRQEEVEWHRATVVTLLVASEMNRLALDSVGSEKFTPSAKTNFSEIELAVAGLRARIPLLTASSFMGMGETLNAIVEWGDTYGGHKSPLSMWVASSVLLARAEISARWGQMTIAIDCAKSCVRICSSAVSKMTQGLALTEDADACTRSRTSQMARDLVARFVERQRTCLLLVSDLHAIIGEHRKAGMYLLSAYETCGRISTNFAKSRPNLREVVNLVLYPSSRTVRCVRKLLSLQGKVVEPEEVAAQLARVEGNEFTLDVNEMSMLAENILLKYSGKLTSQVC